jgi:hypothetical protein
MFVKSFAIILYWENGSPERRYKKLSGHLAAADLEEKFDQRCLYREQNLLVIYYFHYSSRLLLSWKLN